MSEQQDRPPLRIEMGMHGKSTRVFLGGVDISNRLYAVTVKASVEGLTRATLEYIGAAVIEGETGEIALEQHPVYVECPTCAQAVQGTKREVKVIDRTGMNEDFRQREVVRGEDGEAVVWRS